MGESPTYKIFNDPNPNLNFKVGLLDKLLIWDETDEKYVFNTEELENCNVGDFYVAGYSEESAFPTFLIEENEDPQYCKGASLIINTDGGPMFISHMPGE
jgi:hypothetical protein